MIISASRRTDIPSYHGRWLMNRLHAGYALTRNPMNLRQIQRVCLSPQSVDCIVFWTKNAAPFLPYLDEIEAMGYAYYFQHTLTPYGADLEPGLPPKEELLEQVAALGSRIGRQRLVWRYDPIILTSRYDMPFHLNAFERYCRALSPYTDEVVISFFDLYKRLQKSGLHEAAPEEIRLLAPQLGQIAASYHLRIRACSEAMDLSSYGIERGSCIDLQRISRITHTAPRAQKDAGQRPHCGCSKSVDIGAYNTCLNGCHYCYANYSKASIDRNLSQCDPDSPFLLGQLKPGEHI
ncbi:MAG: DUF1848 domain-containing protein [Lachnospiraceae bacterium]|jgi:hypothetical protein|nr:DUF1848 domain-containing protein [Lachnospiraceae bacterium]